MTRRISAAMLLASAVAAAAAILADSGDHSAAPRDMDTVNPRPYYGDVARQFARKMSRNHVLRHPFDNEISRRAWTNLVTSYDFNRDVFLKSDLDRFAAMKDGIDEAVLRGDVSFGFDVFRTYYRRLAERLAFATNLLATAKFDFTVKEEYLWQRKDAEWPATREEQDDLWRRRIKNEVLSQLCSHRLDEEKHPPTNGVFTVDEAVSNLVKRYRQYYVVLSEPDEENALQRYLSAVATAYDPHSDYMSPESKEDFDMGMNLSLCGIGAVLQMDEGALKIREIMTGGPLDRDGRIKAGDKIVGVGQGDGPIEDIMYRPMNKTIRKIRGPKGTKVVLEIAPKSDPMSRKKVDLVRDEIKLDDQAATGKVEKVVLNGVTNTFGYVKLPSFYGTMDRRPGDEGFRSCTLDVAREIGLLNAAGAQGFVFDLRGNGGGSLREAVTMAGLFLRSGPVVLVRDTDRNISTLPIPSTGGSVACRKPLVVLIDQLSASASEIVAGVLRDTGRAIVVGDSKTHGKGTVQSVMAVGGEEKFGSVKITTARFYRINGSSTQLKGVESDIVIPSVWDEMDVGEDSLPNALPWSSVEPVGAKVWNLPDYVQQLKVASSERLAANQKYKKHLRAVRAAGDASKRKIVPLNFEDRLAMMRKDREGDEKLEDAENAVEGGGLDEDDDEQEDDKKDSGPSAPARRQRRRKAMPSVEDDVVLAESLNILADLVRLTDGADLPAQSDGGINGWMRFFGVSR